MQKAIILSGGSGTRLYPLTMSFSKQLLPIYSKPTIYYPLSTLMSAGIKDILIITTPDDSVSFKKLLGDGSKFGINLTYAEQPKPEGLAQAFIIANNIGFISDDDNVAMILGDNIFYGSNFNRTLKNAIENTNNNCATVFGYYVEDPQRYGIAEIDNDGNCIGIEEKPLVPKSDICVTGLYFYPSDVVKKAKKIIPSKRGELEISTLNQMYVDEKRLKIEILNRGFAWFDTGTFDSFNEASNFVRAIEKRQGLLVGSPEEIAYRNKWINKQDLIKIAEPMLKNDYGRLLMKLTKK
jgi:glucose-1-phosphate thymidylyltransferase